MRKTLRNKEVKELINTINDVYSYTELTKKDKIEIFKCICGCDF